MNRLRFKAPYPAVLPLVVLPLVLAAWLAPDSPGNFRDWWLTADQQGERLMASQRYLEASEKFEDPAQRALALYRAGEFDQAAASWGRMTGADASFNRGNALVFQGQYEAAIDAYSAALDQRPGWSAAEENRQLAELRLEALQAVEDDAGGTGGKLGADEIVFDDTGRVNKAGTDTQVEVERMGDDQALRATWLRRVQNDPQEFLRIRFAYQQYRDEQGDEIE